MIEELILGDTRMRFNKCGLGEKEQEYVRKIATEIINNMIEKCPWATDRCTFFADNGYKFLQKAVEGMHGAGNPRIEGDDNNPFNQHYWLAFDINGKAILIDPIFGYLGLEKQAGQILPSVNTGYYQRKRVVPPDTSQGRGGVRVKTISI